MTLRWPWLLAGSLLLFPGTAFADATVRIAHFAAPDQPVALTYTGGLANSQLPATLLYGQTTEPVTVATGTFGVRAVHGDSSVTAGTCEGTLADGDSKLLALSTATKEGKPTIQCSVIDLVSGARDRAGTKKDAKAGGRASANLSVTSVTLTLVHLAPTAGDGWLSAYPPGGAYTSPCSPTVKTNTIAYGSQAALTLDVGRHDLAFVRACSTASIDVPAVQDSVVVNAGHRYVVLVVPDASGDVRAVRLVVVTEKE